MGGKKNERKGASSSKRRSGSLQKATDLCTLCAFETALLVFSPDGESFTVGHPCLDAALNKLAFPEKAEAITRRHEAEHQARLCDLNKQLADALAESEAIKKKEKELKQKMKMRGTRKTVADRPIDDLNLQELNTLYAYYAGIEEQALKRIEDLSVQTSNSTTSTPENFSETIDPPVTNPAGVGPSVNTHGHNVGHENEN